LATTVALFIARGQPFIVPELELSNPGSVEFKLAAVVGALLGVLAFLLQQLCPLFPWLEAHASPEATIVCVLAA